MYWVLVVTLALIGSLLVVAGLFVLWRYKRCPEDKVLFVFDKGAAGRDVWCGRGAGHFVWPRQEHKYLSLAPVQLDLSLPGAKIAGGRIDLSAAVTVAVTSDRERLRQTAHTLRLLDDADLRTPIYFIVVRLAKAFLRKSTLAEWRDNPRATAENLSYHLSAELDRIGLTLLDRDIEVTLTSRPIQLIAGSLGPPAGSLTPI